jgi:hypothetical protein
MGLLRKWRYDPNNSQRREKSGYAHEKSFILDMKEVNGEIYIQIGVCYSKNRMALEFERPSIFVCLQSGLYPSK